MTTEKTDDSLSEGGPAQPPPPEDQPLPVQNRANAEDTNVPEMTPGADSVPVLPPPTAAPGVPEGVGVGPNSQDGSEKPATDPSSAPVHGSSDDVQHGEEDPPPFHENQELDYDLDNKTIRRAFVRKIFLVLSTQLMVTCGLVAVFTFVDKIKKFVVGNIWIYMASYAFFFIFLGVICCCGDIPRQYPRNLIALSVLTLLLSYMVGMMASFHDTNSVVMAVGITVFVCFMVVLFTLQARWNFTSWRGVLFAGVMALVGFGLLCIIIRNHILQIVYAGLGAFLFSCVSLFMLSESQCWYYLRIRG